MARIRIKEVAEGKGILQSHLQLNTRVTPTLLRHYWYSKTHTVDLIALEKIARALGVTPGELIVEEDTEEKATSKDDVA